MGDQLGMSNILNNIGAVYFNQGDDSHALEYYLNSLTAAEKIGDKHRIASAMGNIGAVYYNQLKYDQALTYYLRSIELSRETGNKTAMATAMVNAGEIFMAKGENDSALVFIEKSLQALEGTGNKSKIAYSLNNMGKAYARKGDFAKALQYQQEALATSKDGSAQLEVVQSSIGLGDTYSQLGKTASALAAYQQASELAEEIGANYELKDAYQGLAASYAKMPDYRKAYEYQLKVTALKDSLFNTETTKKMVNLQANYENEKKQAQIDLLTKDKALQDLEIQTQKLVRNTLLAGFLLILILAFVLFRNNQIKVKANRLLTLRNEEINHQKEEIASQRDNLEQTYNHLKNTQGQLVQSEKMASLGQLTAGVAHEINNPINFVSAGIDSLKDNFTDITEVAEAYFALNAEEDNKLKLQKLHKLRKDSEVEELIEESRQLFKSIKNGANRTTEIVKSLKNFTRLDENTIKQADLQEGLDSTLVILSSQMKDRIEVVRHYGNIEPIACYPGQLNQVFMNILSNAIQAIKGEGTIWIQTYKNNECAIVKIKDSGIGMNEEVKKHIFEPFFTTKDVGEGTGLGLSISYSIIEKHHGKIEVESTPGLGTEFIIKLPLQLAVSAEKVETVEA
jgi:signal transduction histidine kinase